MGFYDYYRQPTVAEIRHQAEQTIKKAEKKGIIWEPITIDGQKIAKSWWGEAWCKNLEHYADYENRLARGRKYVRACAVVDLHIFKGTVTSKVIGSGKTPYEIEINISPLPKEKIKPIVNKCSGKLANAEALISGKFPDELKELFVGEDGLFPTPKEIQFNCSCPDWADMCKHVAASLYGIGARLDTNPVLFFTLRGIDLSEFIDAALSSRVETMLENAETPSSRIMNKDEIEGLFGIL